MARLDIDIMEYAADIAAQRRAPRICGVVVVGVGLILCGGCTMFGGQEPPPTTTVQKQEPIIPAPPPLPDLGSANAHTREALTYLGIGDWELGRRHLERALAYDAAHPRASLLLGQLVTEPKNYLGEKYFRYTVRRNESLSIIAQKFLGSRLKFPILARLNDIDNPSTLAAGTVITVPGSAPKPRPRAQPPKALLQQALDREQAGDLEQARPLLSQVLAADPNNGDAQDAMARIEAELVSGYIDEAYSRESAGDTTAATALWKKVCSIDPENVEAEIGLGQPCTELGVQGN